MKIVIGALILIIVFISCTSLKDSSNRSKIGNLIIRKYTYNNFHYLGIVDNKRALYFNYPVGEEEIGFSGGIGPIFEISKRNIKSNTSLYLMTSATKDSVCFLNYCYKKEGTLTELEVEDKILFQKVDSFCRANYSFYKRDIKEFKFWYLPEP